MNSDSYFRIGSAHDICDDYALSGANEETTFAVMSDGCSGSPMTDFGSRFLTLSTGQLLLTSHTKKELDNLPKTALRKASLMAKSAALDMNCLDATLGYVYNTPKGIQAFLAGDGAIAAKKRNGDISISIIYYVMNTPPYLSYALDGERTKLFLAHTNGCEYIVQNSWLKLEQGHFVETANEMMASGATPHRYLFDKDEYELVMVMSDGICTFQKPMDDIGKNYNDVDPVEIIKELMSVKSYTGEFIKRRAKRMVKDLCIKKGWRHLDDFSVAALYCGEIEEKGQT